jgi:hypothetical protein
MSGAVARPETGLLGRRAGCGKAASPDLWGRWRVTAASTRPVATLQSWLKTAQTLDADGTLLLDFHH